MKFKIHLFYLAAITAALMSACNLTSSSRMKDGELDWRLYRGNPSLSGYSSKKLPDNPVLLWSYKTGVRTVSSPTIENGTTYWCNKRGKIYGVNLKGELSFEYDLKTAVEATPMIFDSTLYIGRIDGVMTAISLSKKDTLWNYATMGQISASPNLGMIQNQEAIVFGSYDNFFYCIDLLTGKEINRFESGYYINGAGAICKNSVLFGGCDAYLRVIDCDTGTPTDSLLLDAYIPSSPAIMGNFCYVADYSGTIYEVQLEKGKIIRSRKLIEPDDKNGAMISVPALDSDLMYYLTDDQYLCAIDRKNRNQKWKFLLKGNVGESSPLVCNDQLIVCTKTGIITIHDAATGKQLWEYDTGEQIVGSPAIIDNHFMILTAKGTLFCFGKTK
nr:PQQ-binding-like beta-propeller repeat protein [uncultured Carboxylicivirga sp.]